MQNNFEKTIIENPSESWLDLSENELEELTSVTACMYGCQSTDK